MSATTYDDVIELLGDIDDLMVERIVATGATTAEVAEAFDCLEDERRFGEQRWRGASPRVAAVREILEDLVELDDDDSWVMGDAAG